MAVCHFSFPSVDDVDKFVFWPWKEGKKWDDALLMNHLAAGHQTFNTGSEERKGQCIKGILRAMAAIPTLPIQVNHLAD
jgi:hypothetical protein